MTFTFADESDVFAVGRPFRLNRRSAHGREFLSLLFSINTGEPQLLLCGPHRPLAVGRNLNVFTPLFRATHLTQQSRRRILALGLYIQRKDLLLCASSPALRIGALLLPVQLTAQHKDHGLAEGSEPDAGDGLAIVGTVMSDRARRLSKIRTVSHPHVADSLGIEHPSHAAAVCGRHQASGEG